MLTTHHITKSYSLDPVLQEVSFSLQPGERMGLVGPNGCGKTTLLRIIAGQEKADSGVVQRTPSDIPVGYLPQGFENLLPDETLGQYLDRIEGGLDRLSDRLAELAEAIVQPNPPAELQAEYDQVLAQINHAAQNAGRAAAVLAALNLAQLPRSLSVKSLSGGQKTRLGLVRLLIENPPILLLDEPTNHLDLEMLSWLENWLKALPNAVLIVSHDRAFLDQVATSILEIDPLTHQAHTYPGNFSDYLQQKQTEREHQWQEYTDQQSEISRLRRAASKMRGLARQHKGGKTDPTTNTDGFALGFFADRGKETIQKAKGIEKRVERLLTVEHVEKPGRTWQMKMEFGSTPASSREILVTEDLTIGYPEVTLLQKLNIWIRFGERVALVGPNGSGKTTLIRTLTGQIPPLSGRFRLGPAVQMGIMAQEQEELEPLLNAFETIQSITGWSQTEARSYLSKFLFKGDGVFSPAGQLSYGERARLSLACLVARGCNFLILDEPLNHLDIPSRAQFEQALADFDGTILAILHDRYFIQQYATTLWEVQGSAVRRTELT